MWKLTQGRYQTFSVWSLRTPREFKNVSKETPDVVSVSSVSFSGFEKILKNPKNQNGSEFERTSRREGKKPEKKRNRKGKRKGKEELGAGRSPACILTTVYE